MAIAPQTGLTTAELVHALPSARLHGDGSVRLSGVHQDSRRIARGDLFCARRGEKSDGLAFAAAAVRQGAAAILLDAGGELPALGVPLIEVPDARRALGYAAEAIYGFPSRTLSLVGITGTNGKTTTSLLVEHTLAELGAVPARLGTLGLSFRGRALEGTLTTPEADDLSRTLAEVRDAGGSHAVMEVSSHALELGRVAALGFKVAAFTNLTQDHLDFHGGMDAYGRAKARLFDEFPIEASVINVSDPFGEKLAESARGRVLRVARAGNAELVVLEASISAQGIRARVRVPGGEVELVSRLVGEHNLENLLVALGIAGALGFDFAAAAAALGRAPQVPGRLERCDEDGDDLAVFVDYAHTPDALERVLAALTRISAGEVWCLFGCGGDRDPLKRPKMGAAVARGAARAIITSDNPRSEDPAAIIAAIEPALSASSTPYVVELDRARAIEQAVLDAPSGATLLLAGKGHEPYQIIGSEKRPFDDRAEARRALAKRRARAAS
ncbi:MAG TPA: UDP-N-acetylmuramoyl-L-alanyl-D-glutamate--2,6-diaminopimelate ligase [Polyangiaceae bacterium]|nr:UDP-N-acetylmuramoyl-L-alanyl-D-glutamate--2,6-diaminopimelate ligase [Polyangiaceae bacterium]